MKAFLFVPGSLLIWTPHWGVASCNPQYHCSAGNALMTNHTGLRSRMAGLQRAVAMSLSP